MAVRLTTVDTGEAKETADCYSRERERERSLYGRVSWYWVHKCPMQPRLNAGRAVKVLEADVASGPKFPASASQEGCPSSWPHCQPSKSPNLRYVLL